MTSRSQDPQGVKYDQIPSSQRIRAFICRCFEFVSEEDERKFMREFLDQPRDSDQIMHTLRELVLGAYLGSKGFVLGHDLVLNGQTPDWCLLDSSSAPKAIAELTNLHIDRATENEIGLLLQTRGIAVVWRDGNTDNVTRLYHSIWRKAEAYKTLVEELNVPYVVALFGEFTAALDLEEVCSVLFDQAWGLFSICPDMSGLLYFEERGGQYLFRYLGNPNAVRPVDLPDGVFPPKGS